jgi:integrase/recombinase XerD
LLQSQSWRGFRHRFAGGKSDAENRLIAVTIVATGHLPIGERALAWINACREQARERLLRGAENGILFLTNRGGALSVVRLTALVEGYINQADTGKKGSCHLFRHSTATILLDQGMDIRYLQTLLGHAEISTTQIYTHVSLGRLKDQHTAMHPGKLPQVGQFSVIEGR